MNRETDNGQPGDERPATLLDVAARAGVSTATVSRALNAPERVSEKTRRRVLEAVEALGYAPNFGARALAARRTRTVGAVIPTMENAIFARGLEAFQAELRGHGYTLLVASSGYDPGLEAEQVRALVARGADGLLMIGHARDPSLGEMLRARRVPFVVAWAHDPKEPAPAVGFDNRSAMRELARRVIALGHRRIGVISAPRRGNDRAGARVEGIAAAIAEAGLPPDAMSLVETPYGIDEGAAALERLMRRPMTPSVVMCGNDVLAAGALLAARRLGLDVPRELSITGFDDIELARVLTPPITTVHVPHAEMGVAAARSLLEAIETGRPPEGRLLATHVVERESLAPAP